MDSASFTTTGSALADPIVFTSANGGSVSSWTSVNGFTLANGSSVPVTVWTTVGPVIVPAGTAMETPPGAMRGAEIQKITGGTPLAGASITIATF